MCTPARMQMRMHARMHACTHAYLHASAHANTQSDARARMHATHANAQTRMHACTCMHMYALTHMRMCAHMTHGQCIGQCFLIVRWQGFLVSNHSILVITLDILLINT